MKPYRITPPVAGPVSLPDFKRHARVDFDDDDPVLEGLLAAAVDHLDGYHGVMGRCIVNQQWAVGFSAWELCLRLPFPDVSAAAIKYRDIAGDMQTVSSANYEIIQGHGYSIVRFKRGHDFPELSDDFWQPVLVEFTAGFGAPDDVPPAIKAAISQLAAHWYENREAVGKSAMMPLAYGMLIAPFRVVPL